MAHSSIELLLPILSTQLSAVTTANPVWEGIRLLNGLTNKRVLDARIGWMNNNAKLGLASERQCSAAASRPNPVVSLVDRLEAFDSS